MLLFILIVLIGYGFYAPAHVEIIEDKTEKYPYIWVVLYPIVIGEMLRNKYDKYKFERFNK